MKRMSGPLGTGLAIVLLICIGAAVTWLSIRDEDSVTAARLTVEPRSVRPQVRSFPNTQAEQPGTPPSHAPSSHAAPSNAAPSNAATDDALPGIAPTVIAARPSPTASRDDATYFRVLAAMQAVPEAAIQVRPLMAWHEAFALTPDDPGWARPMERALREFVQKQTEVGRLEVTSVSCRSEHCEVQLLAEMSGQVGPADEGPMMPPKSLVVPYPVGPSLREQAAIRIGMGDRSGIILMYKRMREGAEANAP